MLTCSPTFTVPKKPTWFIKRRWSFTDSGKAWKVRIFKQDYLSCYCFILVLYKLVCCRNMHRMGNTFCFQLRIKHTTWNIPSDHVESRETAWVLCIASKQNSVRVEYFGCKKQLELGWWEPCSHVILYPRTTIICGHNSYSFLDLQMGQSLFCTLSSLFYLSTPVTKQILIFVGANLFREVHDFSPDTSPVLSLSLFTGYNMQLTYDFLF